MITAKQISEYVENHQQEAIECLQEILRVPSVTENEEPVSFVFEKFMNDIGLNIQRIEAKPHRPNLIGTWKGEEAGRTFLFNGHMDVFPPDPTDAGIFGPWSGKVHEGCIYGRGSVDMKGGDAGALVAVAFLKKMGFKPKGSIVLSWMCDEEYGGRLGVQYLLKNGYLKGDFGLCMEPTHMALAPKQYGILRGYISYFGYPDHTAMIYKGDTCIQKAIKAINGLYELNDKLEHLPHPSYLPPPHLTIAVFNSGKAANVYPSEATFWFDRRVLPTETHEEALNQIKEVLDKIKKENGKEYEYELTVTSERPSMDISYEDPFVKIVTTSYKEVLGKEMVVTTVPWGADAAWIHKINHFPIPNLGPGDNDTQAGRPNERVEIRKYLDCIKVYMMVLVNSLS